MDFYITPDKRLECERKLDKMFKKLDNKPNVTFSGPKTKIRTTVVYYTGGFSYENGKNVSKEFVDVVEVHIDDIVINDWIIVADVLYNDGIVTICSSEHFKHIPSKYGLSYTKCDHCGGEYSNRKESYILYNKVKDEWMQVGSTCINKMFNGYKYLETIIAKLYYFFTVSLGGCDAEENSFRGWNVPDRYSQAAVRFSDAVAVCKDYYDNVSKEWERVTWVNGDKISGTNDKLISRYYQGGFKCDEEFFNKVCEHIDTLEGGYSEYGEEPTLQQKMKDAKRDEFIPAYCMYIAYFAMKSYLDSLSLPDFIEKVESKGIEKDKKVTLECSILDMKYVEYDDYYGYKSYAYETKLLDKSGLIFMKTVSNKDIFTPYLTNDGTYRFNAKVKYVSMNKRVIGLGGRLSKAKK